MSDTSPRDQAALRWDAKRQRSQRQPKPGELLFEFVVREERWRCELRSEYGFDVQFFCGHHFIHSRRFDSRVVAEEWARGTRETQEKSAQTGATDFVVHLRNTEDT
jgi:hypothetical protein